MTAKNKRGNKDALIAISIIVPIFALIIYWGSIESTSDSPEETKIDQAKQDSIEKAKAERTAYLNRPWKTDNFVDNFGDPTEEKYIYTTVDGAFSNAATKNSYLHVKIIVKKAAAGIFLHEYNSSQPAQKFIGDAQIQMKNESGDKLVINSSDSWNQQGGILIDNSSYTNQYDFSKFRDFLKRSIGVIKVAIFDDYSSSYSFKIDATGFTEEFNKL